MDQLGNFTIIRAKVLGALSWKERIIVEAPSKNPQYPDCSRYYTVLCKDYDIQ